MPHCNWQGGGITRCGIPIGNLTSQLFANVYMNEFDQFVKHELKVKRYARYTDDFIIVSHDSEYLTGLLRPIQAFLRNSLALSLHPKKVGVRSFHQGIDFLGYVLLPQRIMLRTKTKRRMYRKLNERIMQYRQGEITEGTLRGSLRSYQGVLSHADAYQLSQELLNNFWFWLKQ